MSRPEAARDALVDLLLGLFGVSDLRRFLLVLPDGESLQRALPGASATPKVVATEAVDALSRNGAIDQDFFESLLRARPRRLAEIQNVAARFKVLLDPDTQPRSPAAAEVALRRRPEPTRAPATLPASPPVDRAVLVLASFNPDEVLADHPLHLRLFQPSGAPDRSGWESYFAAGLVELRRELQERGPRRVLIHAMCVPSVAMRAGAIFHRRSGLKVDCTWRDPALGHFAVWELDPPPTAEPAPHLLESARTADPDPTELHLTISASASVLDAWEEWRFRAGVRAVALHVEPGAGVGHRSVPDARSAVRMAEEIADLLRQLPAPPPRLRVFCAGPAPLAVALGRALRFSGPVHLMDYDPRFETYVESFCYLPDE